MTPQETADLFLEKFERLNSSRLVEFLHEDGYEFTFDCTKSELTPNSSVPDIEFIESFVLNLRFFLQNNEPISLNNMSRLYETHCADQEVKEKYEEVRRSLNAELDKQWPYRFNGQPLKYRDIFEGMIYSHFAHSKKEGRHEIFAEMIANRFCYYLALGEFMRCIDMVHGNLAIICALNRAAFSSELESP